MNNRKLIQTIIQHLILYVVTFAFFYITLSRPLARDVSPKVHHIILLSVVIIGFPLISVVWEIERRKLRRKKQDDISKHGEEINH